MKNKLKTLVLLLLAITLLIPTSSFAKESAEKVTVLKVVDGDTLTVDYYGEKERDRLIGMDTPESVHPDKSKNTEEGVIASDYAKTLVQEGDTVYLVRDVSDRDRYGRLLRYVYLDESLDDSAMLNRIMVEEGYANAATFPPDVKYQKEFTRLEKEARELQKGSWKESVAKPQPVEPTENTKNKNETAFNRVCFVAKTATREKLESGTWNILNENGETLHTMKVTKDNHEFSYNLPDGVYYLQLVDNPNGYQGNQDKIEFHLPYKIDGYRVELVIEPKLNKLEVPPTKTPPTETKPTETPKTPPTESQNKQERPIYKTGIPLILPVGALAGTAVVGILTKRKKKY